MEIVEYKGWKRNVRLANGAVELIVTLEVGPRVIYLATPGGENVFMNYPDEMGKSGEPEWHNRGGHRLWVAPEDPVSTYFPDNGPVEVEETPDGLRFCPEPETRNGIQKEIDIALDAAEPHVRLVHRLKNIGQKPADLASWALSVMAPGGTGVVGLPERGSHPEDLLPNQRLVLWPYTDLSDPRLTMSTRAMLLHQTSDPKPNKIGVTNTEGWAAYAVHGCLFIKWLPYDPNATYPDMGCNTELFTNADILEVESLGPLVTLEPGGEIEHVEEWHLFSDVPAIATPADVEKHVRPLIEKVGP